MNLHKKTKNRISFFSSFSLLIFYAVFSCALIFTSCENLIEKDLTEVYEEEKPAEAQGGAADGKQTQTDAEDLEPIIVTGQVQINGAVPEDLVDDQDTQQSGSRAAVSTYATSEVQYFVTAVSGTKTVNGSFANSTSTFSIPLTPNLSWNITCGLKKRSNGDTLFSETKTGVNPSSITASNPLQFFPTPDVSGGETSTGEIELSMTVASTISSVKLSCYGSNKNYWPFTEATVSDTTATIQTDSAVAGKESVRSGAYEVAFAFYKADGSLAYTTIQTINVCKGLKTKKWITSGGESPINSSGVFNVTAEKIAQFASTNFYVGATGVTGAATPSDSNSGSHKAPYATLGRALTQIANCGNSENDYTIHISGLQKVATSATAGFKVSDLDEKMNSLTLTGLNNNTTDILDGDGRFCTLLVDSEKDITIENLTFRNGNSENGGGVGKKGSGKLTLKNCIVKGNTATAAGGGFCAFEDAGDCKIKNCHFELNTAGSNGGGVFSRAKTLISNTEIINNTATASGGGCYLRDKDMTISGSQTLISQNHATNSHGGGVCVATNNSLLFKDGTISENEAQLFGGGIYSVGPVSMTSGLIDGNKSLDDTDSFNSGGGGVCVKNTFTMSGGVISGNVSGCYGGGILLLTSDSKVILSGNAVIGDITKETPADSYYEYHSNSAVKGGGIFNYEGKVYIGYKNETTPDNTFSGGVGYNYVTIHGGGIYSIGSTTAEVYINKARIQSNTAVTYAGGIDIYNGRFEINDSQIKNNKADNGGGLGLGRTDGNPICSIKNTNIQNNNANSNGAAIYLYGGNTTLINVEITNNHAGLKAGGIFFNALGTQSLFFGNSSAESKVKVYDNTAGAADRQSNVYLNANDVITIAGELNYESRIGITRATAPTANVFTVGFRLNNHFSSADLIFISDDITYNVVTLAIGEAKLRTSGAAGPALNWFYAAGDACMALSSAEMERIGVPEYHDSANGTSFTLNRTSTGPFYNAETGDDSIFTGNVYLGNPATGTQVTAGTETSEGIPYTIAADAITDDVNIYLKLNINTVYLNPNPTVGNDDKGGFTKDLPIQSVAQAKRILKSNTTTNPVLVVMGTLSDKSEIEALSGLTCNDEGAASIYNGAIVKRHSDCDELIKPAASTAFTLSNVTLDGGAVWSKSVSDISSDIEDLTSLTNSGVQKTKALITLTSGEYTFENVTIQNCDNSSTSSDSGAGINIQSAATANLSGCTIKQCRAKNGAVGVPGKLNATGTSFIANYATVRGGAVSGSSESTRVNFDGCSFLYNGAGERGGAVSIGHNWAYVTFNGTSAAGNNTTVTGNASNLDTPAASRTSLGNFYSGRANLTLKGSFNFSDNVDFYIINNWESHAICLESDFTNSSSNKAKIYVSKGLASSAGEYVLSAASDSTINIATAKDFFELAGTDSEYYEISDEGKITSLPSGGNIYTAMDYVFTLSADKNQVSRGEASVITITPTVKRKEANGNLTPLYYKAADQKLYEDSSYTILAGGNNTVSWSTSLMCGPDVEYDTLEAAATANQFTIPALAWEDNYTLNVTVTYMGLACDTSFAVECVEHAFNATAYTDNGDGTVYFGDWPQSAKASGVTVNEAVSLEIGALTYYLGSDNAWYAKLDTDYFKVEPVKWKILTNDYNGTGYKLLFATKILEGRPYDSSSTKYDTSAIRAYLNGDFKNTAFSTAALQSIIQTVEVDNSARSTNPDTNPTYFNSGTNPFACDNTNDQIFLLSLQEITTAAYGFNTDPTAIDGNRNYSPTGYALKNGANSGGWWMTRSPDVDSRYLRYSNEYGRANGGSNQWKTNSVGMIPALCVTGN